MKHIYTSLITLLVALSASAQTPFWTENFGSGCNRGQLASAYTGTNGAWTIASTGSNGSHANTWFVSATSANTGAANCQESCIFNFNNNGTLHVSNVTITIPNFVNVLADTGSSYFTGGFSVLGITSNSSQRAESPTINCTGQTNVTVSFIYIENGQSSIDDAQLVYSPDNGTTWTVVDALAKTSGCAYGQWTAFSATLPASADNNAAIKIGFAWVNNDDGQGSDPSFSVDDIALTSGTTTNIPIAQAQELNVYASAPGEITVQPNGQQYRTVAIYNALGQSVAFTQQGNIIALTNAIPGVYVVNMNVAGKAIMRKLIVQ
jgi:hypothetical protein